jgi:hypothetical protein
MMVAAETNFHGFKTAVLSGCRFHQRPTTLRLILAQTAVLITEIFDRCSGVRAD